MPSRTFLVRSFALVPALVVAALSIAFRPQPTPELVLLNTTDPLQLPPGWAMPPVPADNPITQEKFLLGRQLFYEVALSGDNKTSCASCHNPRLSFAARGSHAGAFGEQSKPARMVPRLMNVGYDSVLTWDGHLHSLEEQVHIAVVKKGDLQADTVVAFRRLANNPAYVQLFTKAFGDATVTLDRIAKAIATFERCLISAESPYDQYLRGDKSALSASAESGMKLFFDTTKTNCAFCHSSLDPSNANSAGQLFSDNNYYRTGTFEPTDPRGGYGFDTTGRSDTAHDPGRAAVTRDTNDVGKFRTPSLRNVTLSPPFGAAGSASSLAEVIANYNHGGTINSQVKIKNQSTRIKELKLDSLQMSNLAAFLTSLTDLSFISNTAFQDPGPPTMRVDDHYVADGLSLYPNPSSGIVTVKCPDVLGSTTARLISSRGETVWQKNMASDGMLRLDLAGVPNGAYRLELIAGSSRHSSKIVLGR